MNDPMEKTPVDHLYKGGFFKNRDRLQWRAPIVGNALIDTFGLESANPSTLVDVGCAIGDYVHWLNENGFNAYGIEGSEAAREFMVTDQILIWDLREPLNIDPKEDKKYNIAFSLEVAEHIEPFYSGIYVDNLCKLSDTILISAATPGQKGHHHVNCAPRKYWIDKFKKRGYQNMKGYENRWRQAMSDYRTKKELSSYIGNVIVFRKVGI